MGLSKGRKIPQSVKVKRRIAAAVAVQIANKELIHLKELQQRDSDIKGLTIQVEALNSDLTEAQKQNTDFRAELKKAHESQAMVESQLKVKDLDLAEADRQLAQKNAHYKCQVRKLNEEIDNLKSVLRDEKQLPIPFVNNSAVIHNWRDGWKWISSWSFALIVFFATTPIPPELLVVLPENIRGYLIAFTALCGFVGRYLNQSKGIQQWQSKY